MEDAHIPSTAYLVAHAYADPNGKMLPQVHAVCIYSESATSLSLCPRNTAALGVYETRADDYQTASDMLCHAVQTLDNFAWCRPLMEPRYAEPIDYLHLEFKKAHAAATETLCDILQGVLRCSEEDARRYVKDGSGPLVRASTVEEINESQRTARAWHKRAFEAKKEVA